MTSDWTQIQLLSIARCRHLATCLDELDVSHACRPIVAAQRGYENLSDSGQHQVPEPWVGHLDQAMVLFLSSNPSIDPNEHFPTLAWDDDALGSFFEERFESGAIKDGTRHRRIDGSYQRSHYWSEIRNRATEIIGRTAIAGRDYALSEVVHCKSERQHGVEAALATCVEEHLDRVLSLSAARVVVSVAEKASRTLESRYGLVFEARAAIVGPIVLAGRERLVIRLPGPGSSGVRRLQNALSADEARVLRAFLKD